MKEKQQPIKKEQSLYHVVLNTATKYKTKPALRYFHHAFSYKHLLERINQFAFALKEWGIKNKMVPLKISSLELHPSYGALVRSGEDTYLAGRRTWLENKGIKVPMPEEEVRRLLVNYMVHDALEGEYDPYEEEDWY